MDACSKNGRTPSSRQWYGCACLRFQSVSGLALVCLALASCLVLEGGCRKSRTLEPRDQELISIFHADRQAFERLQKMATEDARRGWYLGGSDLSKLDQPRRDEYKNLISQIRPGLIVAVTGPTGGLRFMFSGEGVAIGPGWVKGIEYGPGDYSPDGVFLPDLDKAAGLPPNVYLRQIEPNWFIFYQRDE
jgi:hypothetical protein